jgi:hypothetical protein
MTARGFPAFASVDLPELEALLDLSMRLGQIDQRLQAFERAMADAADGDDILARLDAIDARLTAMEKRQRRPPPFPISVIENRVETVKIVRNTSNVAAATVSQINGRIHELSNTVAWLRWRIEGDLQTAPPLDPSVAKLAARIEDEERARRQDVKRLDNAVANVVRRIDLAAKVFTRFNRHLTAMSRCTDVQHEAGARLPPPNVGG